jgi:hypothetical protein
VRGVHSFCDGLPTPLPTKEKTIDKVKADIDAAMKKAEEMRDAIDPTKTGY